MLNTSSHLLSATFKGHVFQFRLLLGHLSGMLVDVCVGFFVMERLTAGTENWAIMANLKSVVAPQGVQHAVNSINMDFPRSGMAAILITLSRVVNRSTRALFSARLKGSCRDALLGELRCSLEEIAPLCRGWCCTRPPTARPPASKIGKT